MPLFGGKLRFKGKRLEFVKGRFKAKPFPW